MVEDSDAVQQGFLVYTESQSTLMAQACPLVLRVRNESDPGELVQNESIKIPFHELPPILLPDSQGTDRQYLSGNHKSSGFTPEGCMILGNLGSSNLSFLIYKMTTSITVLFQRAVAAATGGPGMKMASYGAWPLDSISMTTAGALWE